MNIKIEHIALYATDLEAMKDFFIHFFDGKACEKYHNPRTGFSSYFISFTDGARLEIMHRDDIKDCPQVSTGLHHISFSVGSKEQVDALTATLRDNGYPTLSGPRTTGDGYYESCISGPENIIIEITE